ncbi:MAG: glycoside hydrolase family 99-like domain-containing protein [Deltaproteobacteria bacterium]|nr:glycoside hydrolase family 99-like domain-containing protein [Deltaproteobacteria bacterium]
MVKPICFYLPQFHPIPENDEWWGAGFTEWTNVKRATPNFLGHEQPRVPGELGYYDLRDPSVQARQVALAKRYGIAAFCFYYYWFNGRRVLEMPLDTFAARKDLDLGFCVCWANENWTRTWDGHEKHVLLAQNYSPEDDRAFIAAVMPLFKDPRYVRVNDRPVLLVYKVDRPLMHEATELWRAAAKAAGFADLHLVAVQFGACHDPRPYGFDAAVEFPPHHFVNDDNLATVPPAPTNNEFRGKVFDYRKVMAQALNRPAPDYTCYRGVMARWDNTARRQHTPHVFVNGSPTEYRYWLARIAEQTRRTHRPDAQLLFINAWNEWGEGCYLEPDAQYGHAYLQATAAALEGRSVVDDILDRVRKNETLPADAADALARAFAAKERAVVALQQELRQRDEELRTLHDVKHYAPLLRKLRGNIERFPAVERQAKRVWQRVKGLL